MKDFIQTGPELKNQFNDDELLKSYLALKLPAKYHKEVFADLERFGERVITDVLEMAKNAEANPPVLKKFDPWGNLIDDVVTDKGWTDLHGVAAEEKIVRLGYERSHGEYSRLVQFAKLYLYHPSSAFYSCPLAMTDGAAKLIELHGDSELKKKAFKHLTSNDPKIFWTSGQWMTEKTGGSDVSNTETIARMEQGQWRLYGIKWFCSAITANMAFALARIENENGQSTKGSRGLSLFYVELKDENNKLNHFEILRIKDKMGTNALPTAEIKCNGVVAKLIGAEGDGVKLISSMFNVTRVYNAVTSVAAMRRFIALATDYSEKRIAFGKHIVDHPLNMMVLSKAQMNFHASFHLTFLVAEIIGNEEVYDDKNEFGLSKEELGKLARLLTPVMKLYTGKVASAMSSDLLEVFAGVGYIEDSGIPRLYRDNQVFSIWEGTTNVLALDLIRALKKDNSFPLLVKVMTAKIEAAKKNGLQEESIVLEKRLKELSSSLQKLATSSELEVESTARDVAFSLGNLVGAVGMLVHASSTKAPANAKVLLKFFLEEDLVKIRSVDAKRIDEIKLSIGRK